MAVNCFRRRRVFVVFLLASLLCLIYLVFSLPPKDELMAFPGYADSREKEFSDKLITRKFGTTAYAVIEHLNNVLAVPQIHSNENVVASHRDGNTSVDVSRGETNRDSNVKRTNVDVRVHAFDSLTINKTKQEVVGVKTNMEENMKNKTLKQIAMFGVAASRNLPQLVFVAGIWNLTISFEDIGDIMKETQFLNKVDPLNLQGPILLSSRNRTTNFTYAMPLKFGFCDCFDRYCVCCSRVANRRLHLNATACSNFTFVSKTHELDLKFSLDGKQVHRSLISADKSPLLCMGSVPKVADICVHFFNMTFKVNDHQTQLLGCTDLSLNLYNKTIGAFPVDCFQIPGDASQAHKERKFNMMPNWMP